MRDRCWRRFKSEMIYKRRVKKFSSSWIHFRNSNGDYIQNPQWFDFIGNPYFYFFKSGTTRSWDSRYKTKYSPNNNSNYYRDYKKSGSSVSLREKDKIFTRQLINEFYDQSDL